MKFLYENFFAILFTCTYKYNSANKLNEEEIKLTSLNEVWKLISTEIPDLQQSLSEESKNASKQKWENRGLIESQLPLEIKAEILNTV